MRGLYEEPDGPAVMVLWRVIMEVKQRWSVIRWVTKHLLSRVPPCFGRHVKPFVPAAILVVPPTNPHWASMVDYGPISLCVIHKEGLCPSSGDMNGLMMINIFTWLIISDSQHYSAKDEVHT
jgi:hypothetical protein